MRKLMKFGCLGFIGIIAIIIIAVVAIGGGETDDTASNDTSQTENSDDNNADEENTSEGNAEEGNAEEENSGEASETEDDSTITGEEFEQISNGMTYEEVVEIIGSEGTVQSETGEEDSEFHTIIYSWDGADGWGSNAMLTFQDGQLQSKSQAGVGNESESDVTITIDEFNQLENGMTTDEVFEIIGGEGEITSQTGEEGSQYHTVTYTYYGESGMGANATLMFQGGELSSKSQIGLE
ncbi:DUF3862 domain-containing protein [Lentibacillus sp. CBA3610]|uniref:DUF3862 domain-containing protein n=1 Tax=Lentibacillus sp. CBA3610 TaxID=2518176 RepID=UPI00159572B9|nr:DUF3862 domain-containing protein [Lentibacillus sp. CBA3610]QKY68731.1 DUF3862 domain-containing protein [Lentibacillus sp. CBA3610]